MPGFTDTFWKLFYFIGAIIVIATIIGSYELVKFLLSHLSISLGWT